MTWFIQRCGGKYYYYYLVLVSVCGTGWNQTELFNVNKRKLQAWTGPEGSRRLTFPDFKTIGT
jgi:hypothetical protein